MTVLRIKSHRKSVEEHTLRANSIIIPHLSAPESLKLFLERRVMPREPGNVSDSHQMISLPNDEDEWKAMLAGWFDLT